MSARAPSSSDCPITGPTLACGMVRPHIRESTGCAWLTKLSSFEIRDTCSRNPRQTELWMRASAHQSCADWLPSLLIDLPEDLCLSNAGLRRKILNAAACQPPLKLLNVAK
jgi:hypothetical protein